MNYSLFLLVCCYKDITLKSVYNSFVSLSFCILCPLSLSSFFPFIWVISFFLTFILVYLNNFWFYRTLIFWLFIMNKYFWALFYCSSLSFYIKCYGARQVTFINVGVVVELYENLRKLPWWSWPSLDLLRLLGHDLDTRLRRALGLTNNMRSYTYY